MSVADIVFSPILEESSFRSTATGYHHRLGHCSDNESIRIYVTVAGSVIPMRILESDSIASVKLRIQTCKGFIAKKQKLVLLGRELARNDSLVKDYGVTDGNVLHLVLQLSDLLVINVKTTGGKEFDFHVERHKKVVYLKQKIAKKGKDFVGLEGDELFHNGEKLDDQKLLDDICKNTDAVIHLVIEKSAKVQAKHVDKDVELSVVSADWNERTTTNNEGLHQGGGGDNDGKSEEVVLVQSVLRNPPVKDLILEPIFVNPKIKLHSTFWDMINSSFDGLCGGKPPIRSSQGTGGAYFMQDASGNKYVSVFKPIDEEPLAINNLQGLPVSQNGEGLKRGTRVGEGAFREVAAYILDHPRSGPRSILSGEVGFAGVPPTVMVQCLHQGFNHPDGYEAAPKNVKIGSLQMFMKNYGCCEDMGPQFFPVEEVHKISVLDMRMANADRHAGNILVSRDSEGGHTGLIPIDHGYCLPENFEDCTFDWLYWPQSRQPFSPETIEYIKSLDAEQDIELLKFYGWDLSPECARTLRISTMLLKKGAEIGLTAFEIGNIMCRETLNNESMIEQMIRESHDSLLPGMSEAAFFETVSHVMDFHLNKLLLAKL